MARGKRLVVLALKVVAGLLVLAGLVAAGFVARNLNYDRWEAWNVRRAGFVETQAEIRGTTVNYAEGPANGPPLLLIHGQMTDWQSWNRVLPELARRFHIFAVDCYGHGKSDHVPEKYTANALAADMEQFLEQVVGEPAIVAGHSSGGLIAAGLAASAPEWVRGVILEDPPFFSSVLPRARKTFNYVDLSSAAHNYLESGETDFTTYYIRHGAVWDLFLGAKEFIQGQALRYREAHPGEPVKIWFMPPVFNQMFQALDAYDPRFGQAFYDGSFHQDCDHAAVLQSLSVPAVLIHTNWSYDENGILLAAMDGNDAERARSLIPDVEFVKVDSGHGFHFEKPGEFIRIVQDFAQRLDA